MRSPGLDPNGFDPAAPRIVALVLAAGRAQRFGSPKLLARLGDRPLIRHTSERVLEAAIGDVTVVTGDAHAALADALIGLPVQLVQNAHPADGLSGSLKVGVVAAGEAAVLVMLGDQPTVPKAVIRALVEAYRTSGKPIICPVYRGELGNPVLLSPIVFPELMGLTGDRGARSVIERDPTRVHQVTFDLEMPGDVDTPGSLERLNESWHANAY